MEEAIVGRAAEVGRVVAFLSESAAGPRALLLHGEAGIGKTTVWREAVHRARELGRRVLFARPGQSESELPYSALADLLDGIGDEVIAGLPAPQRVAVEAALARGDSTAAPDGHALARGVLGLLRTTGANARVLLAIDDAQWLDRPSASVLTFALRRVERVPLRVLVAVRSSHGSQLEPPLELARWQSNVTYVEVGPLSPTELGAVVARHLGIALPRPRVEELARVSGGNPTFAVELARREEAVRARPDPPTLGQALSARLEALEPEAWDAVVVASAALQPSTDLLLRAGVDAAGIDASVRAGIFALDSGRISFTHPLLGSGAYELLPTDERRTVHERLAGASDSALERGHHLSRASVAPDRSTAEALAAAGCEAAELGDHTGAAAFFLRAAELSVDPAGEEAGRRRVRATLELETAGDIDAAARLARELTTTLPAGLLRAQARRTLVSCEIGTALTFGEGLEELSLALADARDDDGIPASIHVAMDDVMTTGWRFSESLEHLQAAIELAERAGDTATAVAALSDKGFVESLLG
jgi:tetratricopeptide (TPR) repeat protein